MHKEEAAMKKIGMLTSGGDCQALNAAMRGVVKALAHNVDELEIYGFENGYKGLIYENYRIGFFGHPDKGRHNTRLIKTAF